MIDFAKLSEPFPPDEIEWRVGATNGEKTKGMALAYLDARAVMDRLDDVCGPDGWQCRYPHANSKTCCEIGIRVGKEWVWKADGAGDTDFEGAKGAFSDSFKRSAVRFGIGRYLYDLDSPWVEIEQKGRSYAIKQHEYAKLRRLLEKQTWHGPLPRTKLTEELRRVWKDISASGDLDELQIVLDQNKALIEQCKVDMPELWDGIRDGASQTLMDRINSKEKELTEKQEMTGLEGG